MAHKSLMDNIEVTEVVFLVTEVVISHQDVDDTVKQNSFLLIE